MNRARRAGIALIALVTMAVSFALPTASPVAADGHPEIRVAAQKSDGATSLAIQARDEGSWGARMAAGTLAGDAAAAKWMPGSAVMALNAEVRVSARRHPDGRIEVALQQRAGGKWSARELPGRRYLPANARAGVWYESSGVSLPLGGRMSTAVCDRTRQISAELEYATQKDSCAAVTASDLASITSLDLTDNNIRSLSSGDFGGLRNLRTLNLAGNSFTSLPAGVFNGLDSLEVLYLDRGRLSQLPAGAFSDVGDTLRFLFLGRNNLTALPSGVFAGLSKLVDLDISYNGLNSVPSGLFADLAQLDILTIDGNNLSSLPGSLFAGTPKLRSIDASYNALSALPAGLFKGLSILEEFWAVGNNLASLLL